MVFPLSGRSLGVNLLRMPFFKDDKPVCTEAEYLSERGGDKFPYQTKEHVSYEELSPMMDADIRQKFPKVGWLPGSPLRCIFMDICFQLLPMVRNQGRLNCQKREC